MLASQARGGVGSSSPVSDRPAPHKWLFSKEEMKTSASQKDGMSSEEELSLRQQAASFIQEMVDGLNRGNDQRFKISQLGMCVANIHMHRFFYFNSFRKFDYRDVAAACLFLSGKSEESLRKLSHVVTVWYAKKMQKEISLDAHIKEASQLILMLENHILQTIAFDLNVDLPHSYVIRIMNRFIESIMKTEEVQGGKLTLSGDKKRRYMEKIKGCAYYFSSDVLCVMDWAIRYSCKSIAVAVAHLVAIFANLDFELAFPDANPWFAEFDPEMTEEKLRDMENEFLRVYHSCSQLHYASSISFKNQENGDGYSKRVDISEKERRRNNSPRQNFMPDFQSTSDGSNGSRKNEDTKKRDERQRNNAKEELIKRLDKERTCEEERRKREHNKIIGKTDYSTSTEKRLKIDPLSTNFVSSSSHQQNASNRDSLSNGTNHIKPTQQLATLAKLPEKQLSPIIMLSRHTKSSMLTPPPPPPAINGASSSSDMDLEDGELE